MTTTTKPSQATSIPDRYPVLRQAIVFVLALAVVGSAVCLLAWLFAPPVALPVKAPFGLGSREALPQPGGIGAVLLAYQSSFVIGLQHALEAVKHDAWAFWSLLGVGFAYGVFHAAGPGHGKAVISAYIVANEKALKTGFLLSLCASLLQALTAIAIVTVLSFIFRATAARMNTVTQGVELFSFALIAVLGLAMTWRKAGAFMALIRAKAGLPFVGDGCGHVHMPGPDEFSRLTHWREFAGVVVSAGTRPCSGALVILVFALSQGVYAAGIAATFAIAVGTAITTGAIAALAVFAKMLALKLAGGRGFRGALAMAGLEVLAGAVVAVFGVALLFGLLSAAGA